MQITQVHRSEQEKVFITVENNEGNSLEPGEIVQFSATTTAADQGRLVVVTNQASTTVSGSGAKLAGAVVDSIATGAVGRIQVYGPVEVRSNTTIAANKCVVAGTATAPGSVQLIVAHTDCMTEYAESIVGWTLDASPAATTSTIFISTL